MDTYTIVSDLIKIILAKKCSIMPHQVPLPPIQAPRRPHLPLLRTPATQLVDAMYQLVGRSCAEATLLPIR